MEGIPILVATYLLTTEASASAYLKRKNVYTDLVNKPILRNVRTWDVGACVCHFKKPQPHAKTKYRAPAIVLPASTQR
ncbi:hypothetical protein AVEN_228284-1 [Araneus ventricosus]|uniref:Uncharacterized protein n=1 Tax=Araneus ventricosus TaxID=182803 RepID=A0A4Y2EA69_ARAVE|nr:hypothetical protein AVEN_228284-1 [Araneus ventricosus]